MVVAWRETDERSWRRQGGALVAVEETTHLRVMTWNL
jgi:hypothetical protein